MLDLAGRVGDGVVLECADLQFVAWALERVRAGAERIGRGLQDFAVILSTATFVSTDLERARAQVRAQGAVVGNHVAEVVRNVGPASMPAELVAFVGGRTEYDYWKHTQSTAGQADYVPDEMLDRLCIVGDADDCARKLGELERVGVTHVNFYAQTETFEEQMETYAREVVPRLAGSVLSS
jgi:alkanesulfonate monooxygenase SsuD/methylene tetrahydromethanopterin reductase-like flavin-dependent oxidoreductase (luciferase family)